MTQVPEGIRYHRALIEALVRERDEAKECGRLATEQANRYLERMCEWRETAQFKAAERDYAYEHPFRTLWIWLKRKVSR